MFETLERLILLQIGAAAATRERVQETVDRLIEQGRMERVQGGTVVEDVLSRARERSTGARGLFDASVQQGLRGAGVPNRESYEDLLFRVEQLEHRVRILEDVPTPPAAEPTVVPEAEPTIPEAPVGDIDDSASPPGPQPGL